MKTAAKRDKGSAAFFAAPAHQPGYLGGAGSGGAMADVIRGQLGKPHILAALSLLMLVHVLFFAPAGFLTTDEFLYAAMTERLVTAGSLFFDNGYKDLPSDALRLLFMGPTPRGLTPQYPAGYAFLAAPFFLVGGVRGMMILNTCAALGMIYMTYRLAKLLFEDESLALNAALILGLASFIADYAFAILPHAVAGLCMVSATYCAVASQRKTNGGASEAFLSGLLIGIGLNIRVDVAILVPLLIAWIIGSDRAPLKTAGSLCAGLVPGLAIASWLNYLKFGSLSPITYGGIQSTQAIDQTNFAVYEGFLPLLVLGIAATFAFGFPRIRDLFVGWRAVGAISFALIAMMLVPATSGITLQVLKGLYVLLIDLQSYDYIHRFHGHSSVTDEGWILFAGGVKKALFESLPYAGFLVLPLARIFQHGNRTAYVLLFLIPFAWFAFFSVFQWHGGQATNMRYFMPMLPFVAILAAEAWQEIYARNEPREPIGARLKVFLAFALLASAVTLGWNVYVLSVFFLVGSAKFLFFAALGIGIALLALPNAQRLTLVGKGLFVLTLAVAFMGSYGHDVRISDMKRRWYVQDRSDCGKIPVDALVISRLPRLHYCHLMRGGGSLAIYDKDNVALDTRLIESFLDRNRPVLTDKHTIEMLKEDQTAGGYNLEIDQETNGNLFRIVRNANYNNR